MNIKAVLTVEQAKDFCDTFERFNTPRRLDSSRLHALRNATGQHTKATSVMTRWALFYKLHGREKFIDYFARAQGTDYTEQDYLQILEYAVASGTPIDRTWVIFACSRRKLEKLSARRKKATYWPKVEPATPPQHVVKLLDEESYSDRHEHTSESAQNGTTEEASILAGDTIIAMGSTAQEIEQPKPHKLIHGKSQKEVIKLQRPPYKARRKDVAEAKKEQQAIERASAQASAAPANSASASPHLAQSEHAPAHAEAAAESFALMIKAELKDPATYDPLRRGRNPYFNPCAESFAFLPEAVRKSSLKYYNLLNDAFVEATKAALQVPATATQHERFTACKAFSQQHPEYPLKVIILPFGIKYDNFKYYDKYRHKYIDEDPYEVTGAYECLKRCAAESNFRYGKYRLRQKMYEHGYHYCVPTITKLMKRCGIQAITPSARSTRKYSSYEGKVGKLSPNLLKRDFSATKPFQKIVSDVTEIACNGQKLYLSVFEDLFNNEIRAYSISASPSVQFVVAGLKKLIPAIPEDAKCIIHTDQGHQYQRSQYRGLFDAHSNIVQSMSRKGNCYDNGACEGWFGRFKDDVIKGVTYGSMNELVAAIEGYICHYNNERIQMGLDGLSPVAYAQMVAAKYGDIAA